MKDRGMNITSYLKISAPTMGKTYDIYCDCAGRRGQIEFAFVGSNSQNHYAITIKSSVSSSYPLFFFDSTDNSVYVKLRYDGFAAAIERFGKKVNYEVVTLSSEPGEVITEDILT